jgi:phosphopantetheinyl transferase
MRNRTKRDFSEQRNDKARHYNKLDKARHYEKSDKERFLRGTLSLRGLAHVLLF